MNVLFQSLPALVGVAIGAIASYVSASATERARWRRARSTRWDERRSIAYVDYGYAFGKMIGLAGRIAVARGLPGSGGEPLEPDEGLSLLAAAEAERAEKWFAVLLLGDPETITVGHRLNESGWTVEWFARGKLSGEKEWENAWRRVYQLRDEFYNKARIDLGVSGGGNLPKLDWIYQSPRDDYIGNKNES